MAKKKKAVKKKAVKKKVKARKSPAKKRKAAKKLAPAAPALPWREALPGEAKISVVDDYFAHISVAAFNLEKPLAVGDKIHVRGHTTDLTQAVESMQIGHQSVAQAKPGDAVGVKVNDKCRKGDYVYKI